MECYVEIESLSDIQKEQQYVISSSDTDKECMDTDKGIESSFEPCDSGEDDSGLEKTEGENLDRKKVNRFVLSLYFFSHFN